MVGHSPRAVLLLLSLTGALAQVYPASADPVRELLNRRVPNLSPYIELALLPGNGDSNGNFEVLNSTSSLQNISIRGSDPNALAAGVHWYLRYVAGRHLAWNADNLDTIPLPPPRPQKRIQQGSAATWRYAWNVCTHGYTMVWWKWAWWELELDFMALSGVNLPLLFTGQEYIWTRVFKKLNLTDPELGAFFSGPAFLPWQRMGNEAGWGGPLSTAYQAQSHQLQLKILKRARDLGMVPVLPCFGGNVPAGFNRVFPKAKTRPFPPGMASPTNRCCLTRTIRRLSRWIGSATLRSAVPTLRSAVPTLRSAVPTLRSAVPPLDWQCPP
jgi:hypothetical protein